MIREFVTILAFAMLAGPGIQGQQTPENPPSGGNQQSSSGQQPGNAQQPGTIQEPQEEGPGPRKPRVPQYDKWQFNLGAGANLPTGTTNTFVKGGGGVGEAGVARNGSQYLGLRLDFLWSQLPLRSSALQLAQATGATSHVYALNLDPVVNIPVTKTYGAYVIFGGSYYYRSGQLDSSTAIPGSACNGFWDWWGRCSANSIPLNGSFVRESVKQFGANFGAGITRKITGKVEFYGEFRYEHGTRQKITTDYRPITIGVRW